MRLSWRPLVTTPAPGDSVELAPRPDMPAPGPLILVWTRSRCLLFETVNLPGFRSASGADRAVLRPDEADLLHGRLALLVGVDDGEGQPAPRPPAAQRVLTKSVSSLSAIAVYELLFARDARRTVVVDLIVAVSLQNTRSVGHPSFGRPCPVFWGVAAAARAVVSPGVAAAFCRGLRASAISLFVCLRRRKRGAACAAAG